MITVSRTTVKLCEVNDKMRLCIHDAAHNPHIDGPAFLELLSAALHFGRAVRSAVRNLEADAPTLTTNQQAKNKLLAMFQEYEPLEEELMK